MPENKLPPDDPAQSQRFIDMAKEVEADEDPNVFERVFEKIITSPTVDKRGGKG